MAVYGTGRRRKRTAVDEIISPMPPSVPTQEMVKPIAPIKSSLAPVPGVAPAPVPPPAPVVQPPQATVQQPTAVSAADGGPTPQIPDVSTPSITNYEQWNVDPIIGGPPVNVTYKEFDTPIMYPEYYEQHPEATPPKYRLYDPPAHLDDEARRQWENVNKQITDYINAWSQPGAGDAHGSVYNPAVLEQWYDEQRRIVQTQIPRGEAPPETPTPQVNLPPSGQGGTPGQGTTTPPTGDTTTPPTGDTTTPPSGSGSGGINVGEPPVMDNAEKARINTMTPEQFQSEFNSPADYPGGVAAWRAKLTELQSNVSPGATEAGSTANNTALTPNAVDQFKADNPSPADYPGGVQAWRAELTRLQTQQAATPQTTLSDNQRITQDRIVGDFLKSMFEGTELSPEEEQTIRREYEQATARAMSALSVRGLGRGSEAAGTLAQGEFAATRAVGEAKARVRTEGRQMALKAAEILENRVVADRNYQLAIADQNLEALKNAQDVSFKDRAMQLDWAKFDESKKQMEREFGMALDEHELRKFIETGNLNAKIFDIEQTHRLNEVKIVNEYWLSMEDLELQERLGIGKLDLEKWMAGQEFDIDRASLALSRMFKEMEYDIEIAKVRAAIEAAGADGWKLFLGLLSTGAQLGALFV